MRQDSRSGVEFCRIKIDKMSKVVFNGSLLKMYLIETEVSNQKSLEYQITICLTIIKKGDLGIL